MNKKLLIKFFLIVTLIFSGLQNIIQAQVTITPTFLPPYSPYFSDYLVYENKTTIIITNTGSPNRRIYLRGSVVGDNGVSISTKPSFKPATPLILTGPTTLIKGIDLEEYFSWNNVNVFGIDLPKVAQGDGLPEGEYTICLQAFDYDSNIPLSSAAPAGCVKINIRSIEPPIINFPRCGTDILPNPAQTIVFAWNPPPGTPALTRYLIKIAEMPDGQTNYNHALNALTAPPFFEKVIVSSSYTYTLADPLLTVGKTYAFKVVAFDPNNKINFRNGGESEVCYFTYGAKVPVKAEQPITKSSDKKRTSGNIYTQIPVATIKGKLLWAFHKDDEKTELEKFDAKAKFESSLEPKDESNKIFGYSTTLAALSQIDKTIIAQSQNNKSISNYDVVNTGVHGNIGVSRTGKYSPVNTAIKQVGEMTVPFKSSPLPSMLGKKRFGFKNARIRVYFGATACMKDNTKLDPANKSVSTGQTKDIGSTVVNFNLVNTHQLNSIVGQSMNTGGVIRNSTDNKMYYNQNKDKNSDNGLIFLGTTTTDEEGEFSLTVVKDKLLNPCYVGGYIYLEFDDAHFIFPPQKFEGFKLNDDNAIDLGTQVGMAKSYQLEIIPFFRYNTSRPIEKGNVNFIENATIRILRKKSVYYKYANLQKEAQGFVSKTKTQNEYEVIYEGKPGERIPRLFYINEKGNYDENAYQIEISEADFKVKLKGLAVNDPNINSEVINNKTDYIRKTNTIQVELEKPTYVKGTLVAKLNENTTVPLPNINLKLTSVDKSKNQIVDSYNVITDSAGGFLIPDVKPNFNYTWGLTAIDGVAKREYLPKLADGNDKDPQNIDFRNGKVEFNPLYVSITSIPIYGTVKNMDSVPISNAVLKWKQGGDAFFSDDKGNFLTAMVPGEHVLTVEAGGYRKTEVKINVTDDGKTPVSNISVLGSDKNLYASEAIKKAKNTTSYNTVPLGTAANAIQTIGKNIQSKSNNYNLGVSAGYLNTAQYLNAVLPINTPINTTKEINAGTIVLKSFLVRVNVLDAGNNQPISGAIVSSGEDGKPQTTNSTGFAILSDAKQSVPVIVSGPNGSEYVTKAVQFNIKEADDTTVLNVSLKKGVFVKGKVLLNGNGLKEADVFVEGSDFNKTKTDAGGNYKIALENSTYVLKAAKSGYIGDNKEVTVNNQTIEHDFNLKEAGFDATKLLGFDIELYESKNGANANEKIISGAFIKIPSNGLFSVGPSFKMPFNNITVMVQNNKAVPKNGEVKTTVSEIPLELFNYLPLKLRSTSGIMVAAKTGNNEVGVIKGEALLDISKLVAKATRLKVPNGFDLALLGNDNSKPKEFTAFISNGALPVDENNLKLVGLNSNDLKVEYNGAYVKVDLAKSFIFKDGLKLAGSANFGSVPFLGGKDFLVNEFKINKSGGVNFDVAVNINEEIDVKIWKMRLGMVRLTDYGIMLSGKMQITIPETDKISASFANLTLSSAGVSGGNFNLYSEAINSALKSFEDKIAQAQDAYNKAIATSNGNIVSLKTALDDARKQWQDKLGDLVKQETNAIELFKIVTYRPINNTPFSLNRKPGSNEYKIEGAGEFGLTKYIDEKIKLNYFSVATDGDFAFEVPLNIRHKFGDLAEIELTKFGYDKPQKMLAVGGGLFLKLPGFGVGAAATIKYYQGKKVVLEELGFKMAVSSIGEFQGRMKILDQGFEGSGKLEIAKVGGVAGKFVYEKSGQGVRFGVSFQVTPNPVIPVGVVNIGIKGGGFEINTNPGKQSVMVEAFGSLSLVVDPTAVLGINPLVLRITAGSAGPIFEGKGTVVVATVNVGEAGFKIDIPERYLTVYANQGIGFNLIPAAPFKTGSGFRVSASLQKNNEYFMVGMYQNLNIVNLIKQDVNIAFAWGAPKVSGKEEDKYLAFIPDYYLTNGKVFGFGFQGISEMGFPEEKAIGFNIGIASAKLWLYNKSEAYFFGSFKQSKYGLKINQNIQGGASACAIKLCVGLDIGFDGLLEGGYSPGSGWYMDANLSAHLKGYVGKCNEEERNACSSFKLCTCLGVPCGFVVCPRINVGLRIDSQNSLKIRL